MTFKFSINPKDNVMYYILDSEDANVKVKLFKESGTSYVMTSVKAETNDNGATVTYENDEYRQISETNANFLTSIGSFFVLSERDLNSIFKDYMYSFTETKNAHESVYAEQVEERRKTDDKADAEYDISTKKTSSSISMDEYSKIVKTDKGEYGNGTYTIIQRAKVTGKKGRVSQEKLEADISFLGSNAAAVAMNKKITLQMDIDYSFDRKTYKGIKTNLPTYVPTYSYSEDYKMNFNVGGMVTEKTSTAVSYNPNTIFNSLTKDFTPNGCIVDWYYDSAYTKPFALRSPTYDEFHEIKYLYGRLTISNEYAIIARDYKIRDNRTDAYKAVGNVQYDTCYILASYSVSMLQQGTSKENLLGKIESVSDKMFPISYEERIGTRTVLQDGVEVLESISYLACTIMPFDSNVLLDAFSLDLDAEYEGLNMTNGEYVEYLSNSLKKTLGNRVN